MVQLINSWSTQLLLLWPDSTFVALADTVTVAIDVAQTANNKYVSTKSELNWKLHIRRCLWTLSRPVYQQRGVIKYYFSFWPSWLQKFNPIWKTIQTSYDNPVRGSRLPPFCFEFAVGFISLLFSGGASVWVLALHPLSNMQIKYSNNLLILSDKCTVAPPGFILRFTPQSQRY